MDGSFEFNIESKKYRIDTLNQKKIQLFPKAHLYNSRLKCIAISTIRLQRTAINSRLHQCSQY